MTKLTHYQLWYKMICMIRTAANMINTICYLMFCLCAKHTGIVVFYLSLSINIETYI